LLLYTWSSFRIQIFISFIFLLVFWWWWRPCLNHHVCKITIIYFYSIGISNYVSLIVVMDELLRSFKRRKELAEAPKGFLVVFFFLQLIPFSGSEVFISVHHFRIESIAGKVVIFVIGVLLLLLLLWAGFLVVISIAWARGKVVTASLAIFIDIRIVLVMSMMMVVEVTPTIVMLISGSIKVFLLVFHIRDSVLLNELGEGVIPVLFLFLWMEEWAEWRSIAVLSLALEHFVVEWVEHGFKVVLAVFGLVRTMTLTFFKVIGFVKKFFTDLSCDH